jgi:single-strand DNA-binding protein
MNKAILLGRLGKDPEAKKLESGVTVVSFSLATSEKYTDKNGEKVEKTEWHNVTVWNKLAEIIEKYFKKGDPILIEGKITTRKWQDKDGNTRYTTEILANSFEFVPSAKTDNNSAPDEQAALDVPNNDLPF